MTDEPTTDESTDTINETPADTGGEPYNPDYEDGDGDDVVSLEESTIQRDPSTGELQPQKNYVEELRGDVVSKPITRDERERYVEPLLEADADDDEPALSDADLAELFDRKVVKPDLSAHELCGDNVTEKFVADGLTKTQEDGYFIAILLASDEYDLVRMMRNNYTDQEIKMAMAESGNWTPQGDRDKNEARRQRRQQ